MSWKSFVKPWIPPIVRDQIQLARPRVRWGGDYSSWDDARRASHGYDDPEILEKLKTAVREVLKGKAAYERDGFLFQNPQPNLALLAALSQASNSQPRSIIDFGGALGSTYLQNRQWLQDLHMNWTVIEQNHFVQAGRELFQNEPIQFESEIAKAQGAQGNCFLIISSVLQYLPEPEQKLRELIEKLQPQWIFLDRVAYWPGPHHRLTVQEVPEFIYRASYPCWFFNESRLDQFLSQRYQKSFEFPALDECLDLGGYFKGSFWKRKT